MSARQSKNRGTWQEQSMKLALQAVRSKFLTLGQAAKKCDVPKSTLERRVNGKNKVATVSKKHLGRYAATFSPSEKKHMVDYILGMEERFFGITLNDLRKLAYDFAEKKFFLTSSIVRLACKEEVVLCISEIQPIDFAESPRAYIFGKSNGIQQACCI